MRLTALNIPGVDIPIGRLLKIRYTAKSMNAESEGVQQAGQMNVLQLEYRAPDDEVHTFDLPNGDWQANNVALQFLANYGYSPSDFGDGAPVLDCTDADRYVPLVYDDRNGDYLLHEKALEDAEDALMEAEWFEAVENKDTGEVEVEVSS